MAPGGGFEPPRPQEATSCLVLCYGTASPGLLPTWLGDPGTERLIMLSVFIIVSSRNLNFYRSVSYRVVYCFSAVSTR